MRIIIEGEEGGKPISYTYMLTDRFDRATNITDRFDRATNTISMARTTGYTCTAVAHLVLNGSFTQHGINPPEYVGQHAGCFEFVKNYLEERGVVYSISKS